MIARTVFMRSKNSPYSLKFFRSSNVWSRAAHGSSRVRTTDKRLEGQFRIDFEAERAQLEDFLLQCKRDGVAQKRLAWIDDASTASVAELLNLVRQGSDALLGTFMKSGMQKQVADALVQRKSSRTRRV